MEREYKYKTRHYKQLDDTIPTYEETMTKLCVEANEEKVKELMFEAWWYRYGTSSDYTGYTSNKKERAKFEEWYDNHYVDR